MSDDLIRRSDAIEAVKAYLDLCCLTEAKFHRGMEDYNDEIVREIFEKIEPKRGEWIHDIAEVSEFRGMLLPNCKCSVCGCEVQCEANFCPNCGADMRKREDK